eukprot:6022860-Prymnesium_polylepis.2
MARSAQSLRPRVWEFRATFRTSTGATFGFSLSVIGEPCTRGDVCPSSSGAPLFNECQLSFLHKRSASSRSSSEEVAGPYWVRPDDMKWIAKEAASPAHGRIVHTQAHAPQAASCVAAEKRLLRLAF